MWLIPRVLFHAIRAGRKRLLAAGLTGALVTLILPEAASARAHAMALAVSLLVPFMVLGRDRARRLGGVREALRNARRSGRLVVLELALPLGVVAGLSLAWTWGHPLQGLALTTWGAAVLANADALDRGAGHPGAAWATLALMLLVVYTAPFWLAPVMGHGHGPWPATLGIGLHPSAVTLAAAGRPALQDPLFYTWTVSGSVDARPLSASVGMIFQAALAAVGSGFAVRSARRPTRSMT